MNAMNIPGFTAEASLYNTSQLYKLQTSFGAATQGIIPQRIKLKTVRCNCDPVSDICVCDDGSIFNECDGSFRPEMKSIASNVSAASVEMRCGKKRTGSPLTQPQGHRGARCSRRIFS